MTKNLALVLPILLAVAGCGDDTTTTMDLAKAADMAVVATPDMAMAPDMAMNPAKPALGKQIERMGRPTINVAVTNPFDLDLKAANPKATSRDATRDAYNADSDEVNWKAWAPVLAANLAIYDGADATCGNQLLAGPMPVAGRYNALAGALADDRLYLDTTQNACGFYLAVEANATLMLGLKNCGGRTPNDQVVHETYTVATVGPGGIINGGASFAVTDGVPKDPDANVANTTTFPFLGDPN